jgi:hypothetical protein
VMSGRCCAPAAHWKASTRAKADRVRVKVESRDVMFEEFPDDFPRIRTREL